MAKLAIIGTGLIGSSLGLAIKKSSYQSPMVVGYDSRHGNAVKAQRMGALDKAEARLRDAVEDADLVIIATPVMAMREVMETIGPRLQDGCVVTDTGSTKGVVLQWAEELLPESVNFVGGHPMAGREVSGPEAADSSLFKDRTYCIIPGKGAEKSGVKVITNMVRTIGAKPYFIGADEHDSFAAAASHLPLLLSVALVGSTSKSPSWGDIAQIASSGYRDITRLASGDPVMHRDICLTNNETLAHWVDTIIRELYDIRQSLLDSDGKALESTFNRALEAREKWLAGAVNPESHLHLDKPEKPSFFDGMGNLFMGRKLMQTRRRAFGQGGKGEKDGDEGEKDKERR